MFKRISAVVGILMFFALTSARALFALTPVINITNPLSGAVIVGDSVTITADASEEGGSVSRVDFYLRSPKYGVVFISSDTNGADGWSCAFNGAPYETFAFYAIAYDPQENCNSNEVYPVTFVLSPLTLASGGTSTYVIRLCADPTPTESHAADELQQFLLEITGATLPIQQAGTLPQDAILVGRDAESDGLCDDLILETPLANLGEEGFVVISAGHRLVLAGGRPRGTLYAVYSFLQKELGCRWFTPDTSKIPAQNPLVISNINRTFVPALEYRLPGSDNQWRFGTDQEKWMFGWNWTTRNFINGLAYSPEFPYFPEDQGGRVIYAGPKNAFGHTFYQLLPPEEYFNDHPTWYNADSNGTRYWEGGQLCLTNPEVVTAVTAQVRQWLLANPSAKIVSVTQMDNPTQYCQCDTCLARNDALGGLSGTLIEFINKIARNIKDEFPNVMVDTFAYPPSFMPPTFVNEYNVPDANVIIRVCAAGNDGPLGPYLVDGSEGDAGRQNFREGLAGWNAICDHIYLYDYVGNLNYALVPMPDLDVLGPNIKYYAEHNVKGVFTQAIAENVATESSELRAYIIARALADPANSDSVQSALVRDEFLNGCYGPAAGPIGTYLAELEQSRRDTWNNGVNNYKDVCGPDAAYLTRPLLSHAWELFDEAEELVAADMSLSATDRQIIRKRIRTARLPLQFVVIDQGPGWDVQGLNFWRTITGGSPVPWVNKELVEQFLAATAESGFHQLGLAMIFVPTMEKWTAFRDKLIADYGITQKIIFTEPIIGTPNPVLEDGLVQYTVKAQHIIADDPPVPVAYAWTCAAGKFQDTGTTTSTLQNPVWIADVTMPPTGGLNVQIQVTASCGSETPNTSSYLQQVGSFAHTITASAGPHGTISPSGAVGVNDGANQTFTITPNSGCRLVTLLMDNAAQDTQNGGRTGYTFTAVVANHTIQTTFAPHNAPVCTVTNPSNGAVIIGNSVTITANASENGGSIDHVDFYLRADPYGSVFISSDTNGADGWSCSFNDAPQHIAFAFYAIAYDPQGNCASNEVNPVTFTHDAPVCIITNPASGAVIVGNSVTITANASENGGSIARVDFYLRNDHYGSVFMGSDTNGADGWSYTWSGAPYETFAIYAIAYDPQENCASNEVNPVSFWNTADINASGGSASYNSGTFTVAGKGAGITGTADGFRFLWQELLASGNWTLTAKVNTVTGTTSANSRVGVMMRQSTASGAIEASSVYKPKSTIGVWFHRRLTLGGTTSTTSWNGSTCKWVRVKRSGNTLSAWRSTNGTFWTQVGSNTTVTMTGTIDVGLAVTSGNTSNTNTVTISDVTITQP